MSELSVDEILSMSTEDIKAQPPVPRGYYRATIGQVTSSKSREKKTPFVQYKLTLNEAGDDVDVDELAEIGDWTGRSINSDQFWITPAAAHRLARFLKAAGSNHGSLRADIEGAMGLDILVYVDAEPSYKDPDVTINFASGDYLPAN